MRIRIVLPVLAVMAAVTAKVEAASTQAPPASEAAESVTVTATPLPKRDAVDEFIYSYPTQVRTTEKIARWRKGICPAVYGLPPRYAAFITTRLTAIALNVGAPVDSDPKCRQNVEIVFTDKAVSELLMRFGVWMTTPVALESEGTMLARIALLEAGAKAGDRWRVTVSSGNQTSSTKVE